MSHGTLAARPRAALVAPQTPSDQARLATILHVQWALAIACAYLRAVRARIGRSDGVGPDRGGRVSRHEPGRRPLAPGDRCSSRVFGSRRLPPSTRCWSSPPSTSPGQLSIELVLLCLGILILAIAGLHTDRSRWRRWRLTAAYLGVVWFTGGASLWRSSVLLRVPLLFTAAIVYAWLVELGSRSAELRSRRWRRTPLHPRCSKSCLRRIRRSNAAPRRCRPAQSARAEAALRDVATHNRALQTDVRG